MSDHDEESYRDTIPTCRWCGAACPSGLDHCPVCERKVTSDRSAARHQERDMCDELKRNFGHRLDDWLYDDAMDDNDNMEQICEQTFDADQD